MWAAEQAFIGTKGCISEKLAASIVRDFFMRRKYSMREGVKDRLRKSHKSDSVRKHVKPKSQIFEIDGVTPSVGKGEQYL